MEKFLEISRISKMNNRRDLVYRIWQKSYIGDVMRKNTSDDVRMRDLIYRINERSYIGDFIRK